MFFGHKFGKLPAKRGESTCFAENKEEEGMPKCVFLEIGGVFFLELSKIL